MNRQEFFEWLEEDYSNIDKCEEMIQKLISLDINSYAPLIISKSYLPETVYNAISHSPALVEDFLSIIDWTEVVFAEMGLSFDEIYELLNAEDYSSIEEFEKAIWSDQ